MWYSVHPRNQISVKGYEFLSFAKNVDKNICKNIRKNLHGKYRHKLLDHAKQSAADALKTTSKKIIQKSAEATGDLVGNKINNIITKASRSSPQNKSETIANEHTWWKNTEKTLYIYIYIYIQKKTRKLWMIWHWYNSIIMEYQKIINLLNNTPNYPSKFKTKKLGRNK